MGPDPALIFQARSPPGNSFSHRFAHRADAKWENYWIEVITGSNLRNLRAELLALAYLLDRDADPAAEAVCIIVDSKITAERLAAEREMFKSAVSHRLSDRIHVGSFVAPDDLRLPKPFRHGFESAVLQVIQAESARAVMPTSSHTVFAELVRAWLNGVPPQTTSAIQELTGASYPTVANVLKSLEAKDLLIRQRDRSVALRKFPWDEWGRWILASSAEKNTMRFVDQTGRPRSPAALLDRFVKLRLDTVAVGGYFGAQHYFAELDLTGAPRLDLSARGYDKTIAPGFIREIDAGLKLTTDQIARPDVVLHFHSNQGVDQFERNGDYVWENPLNCLADLYDMGLDAQANEMLRHMIEQRNQIVHRVLK